MEILVKPVVTEKMNAQGEELNRFAFLVNKKANKNQIRNAVEKMYNVNVISVNTMNYKGKSKTRYTKTSIISGKSKAYKKAVVALKEGETIDFYSNI